MASTSDLITSTENGGPPVPTTVSNTRTSGATTLECEALTQWPTATKVHFVTGTATTDAEGNPIINPETLQLWSGVVSGTQINDLVLRYSPTNIDLGNNINDIVQMAPDSSWANDLYEGITQDHDTVGYHQTLHDVNGNEWIGQIAVASAINYITISNNSSGNSPIIAAAGGDTNVGIQITGKGSGTIALVPGTGGKVTFGSGLTNGVQSYTNTGSGGGTAYYINLGGIKFCWGTSGSFTPPNGSGVSASLPSGFFTTVQEANFYYCNASGTGISWTPTTISTSLLEGYTNNSGSTTCTSTWWVVGT